MTDAYQPLPLKYRPRAWGDLVGQRHAVEVLRASLNKDRVFSTYIFSGTAGSGKTSAARIFAMALNCEKIADGNPCLECPSCLEALKGRNPDIYEIDGPSYGQVEHMRDLKTKATYSSHFLRTVFIIDEAHSLSRAAFEALLKLLEEPPPHVVFILATTNPERIPATIGSRSIKLDFRRHTEDDVIDRVSYIMSKEDIDGDTDGLRLIARYADGSLRDSVTILDQLSTSHPDEKITGELVSSVLGLVSGSELVEIMRAIEKKDARELEVVIGSTLARTNEFGLVVRSLTDWYRDVLRTKAGAEDAVSRSDVQQTLLTTFSRNMSYEQIDEAIRITWELADRVRYSSNNPKAFFLTGLYRLLLLGEHAQTREHEGPPAHVDDVDVPEPEPATPVASFSSKEDLTKLEQELSELAGS